MRRRDLFKRLGALAAVAAVAPAVKPEEASEQGRMQALVDDVLAHPDKHPDIMARAREMTGGLSVTGITTLTGPLEPVRERVPFTMARLRDLDFWEGTETVYPWEVSYAIGPLAKDD